LISFIIYIYIINLPFLLFQTLKILTQSDDRPINGVSSRSVAGIFRPGDKIEALYKGGTKWFSGEINRERPDGTYDIRYDDGDAESSVVADKIRSKQTFDNRMATSSSTMVMKSSLREGMKVEARYRGKAKYYPGVIKRENRDGTFDVDYNDVNYFNRISLCSTI
jgi:hypothetical protein